MNEILAEFEKKARHSARWQQMVDQDFLEFFAELIIKECAKVTDDNMSSLKPIVGIGYHGVQSEKIKEHFGVK